MPEWLNKILGTDRHERERLARRALTFRLATATPPVRDNLQHVFWHEDDLDRGSLLIESNRRAYVVQILVREIGPVQWRVGESAARTGGK